MSTSSGKRPPSSPSEGPQVPKAVVSRLSLYLRELQHLQREGQQTTNSTQLGQRLGFTDAQVRKDLAYFGQFGYPGIGYRCQELVEAIRTILGTDRQWPVALVGVGNLGRALIGYRGFGHQGFQVTAAFDSDPGKVGQKIDGVPVYAMDRFGALARQLSLRLGMIAVPAPAAQEVADRMVDAGIVGVLNFAPVTLALPPQVKMVAVDLAIELEQLSFAVVNSLPKG
jgi:redox-sensing transcriptional repressor